MSRPVVRARILLVGLFALAGLAFASWLARIPTVRDLLGLSTADLGVLLLVGSLGSLLTVTAAGVLVHRWGSRRVLLVSTIVLAAALTLLGVGPTLGSRSVLAVGIFLNGVAVALGNVAINVEAGRVERALGRTVMPQFHAAFSIGAVAGSGLGALASAAGVPVGVQLPATAVVVLVWRLASLRGVVLDADPATPRPAASELAAAAPPAARRPVAPRPLGGALDAWREPRTLLVGVVVLAAALSEGAANTWLSLAVVDGFDRSESVGGAVLGLFVAAMTVVRLVGTRVLDCWGRVTVLRVSGATAAAGLLLFGTAPNLLLAGAGVVLWGVGAALAVPIGIGAASDDPRRAAGRVAVVSAFASVASLVAPPVLGVAAEHVGARHALLLILVAMLASVAVAASVAPPARPDVVPTPRPPLDAADDDLAAAARASCAAPRRRFAGLVRHRGRAVGARPSVAGPASRGGAR